jgi:hypothetical protein
MSLRDLEFALNISHLPPARTVQKNGKRQRHFRLSRGDGKPDF